MMGQFNKFNLVAYILFFLGGLSLGWFLFHQSNSFSEQDQYTEQESKSTIWTCPQHPEIKAMKPGKCPKCSADLISIENLDVEETPIDTNGVYFTKESLELADVMTSVVTRKNPVKEIRLYGKVQANDRFKHNQVATIAGRIENLTVNSTGEIVRQGQILASIYSPELVSAQQALIAAAPSKSSNPANYNAARNRLLKFNLSNEQLASIEKLDRIKNNFEAVSTVSGIVTSRLVNKGEYVKKGDVLYQVADLSKLWVLFDAYENDLPFLNTGDQISFSLKSMPETNFTAKIAFIDPVINHETRVSKVRVEIDNPLGKIQPEMFAIGLVQANLSEYRDKLVIPELAVLWTGKRSMVYVKQVSADEVIFKLREVKLGPMLGNNYVVVSGLSEGEEIVSQGVFNVNAVAKRERQSNQ